VPLLAKTWAVIAKVSVALAGAAALVLAVVLVQVGVPVGVAATSAVLGIGLTLYLAGRALTRLDPDSVTGSIMIVPGCVLLFVTAVSCLLLGKEYWPRANAFLLFAGGLVAVVILCAVGGLVIDRLVPRRRSQDRRTRIIDDSSPAESQRLARDFFGQR
jgi:hypothetical protein